MNIHIKRIDSLIDVRINEIPIDGVYDYEIKNSADGTTELTLKMKLKSKITSFCESSSQKPKTLVDL